MTTYVKAPFEIPLGIGGSGKTTILKQSIAITLKALFEEPKRTKDFDIKDVPIYDPRPGINKAVKFKKEGLEKYFSATVLDIAGNPTPKQAASFNGFFSMARGRLYVVDGDRRYFDNSIKSLQSEKKDEDGNIVRKSGRWGQIIKIADRVPQKYEHRVDAGYISKLLTPQSVALNEDITGIDPEKFKEIINLDKLEDAIRLFEDKDVSFAFLGDAIIGPVLYAHTPEGLVETNIYAAYTVPVLDWLVKYDEFEINDELTNYINQLRFE
ncbi:hypothetical protein GF352_05090 [archaeon]|nr:hypothetical protein [archaeon]